MTTVLVADDDHELLEMYELWLSQEDEWTTRTATDGDEALERFDDTVDVVVLDRQMPSTTGDEVARHIQSSPHDCGVVMASAFEPDGDIDEETYGAYLTKPVQMAKLIETVQSQLSEPPYTGH